MYKEYLIITKHTTLFCSTLGEFNHELKYIEQTDIIFAGKIKIEQVYDVDRKQLVFV